MQRFAVLLIVLFIMTIGMIGCLEDAQTPPWSDEQIKQMEDEGVDSVPLLRMKL